MKYFSIKYLINFLVAFVFLTPIVMIFSKGLISAFTLEENVYLSRYISGTLIIIIFVALIVLAISVPLAWMTTMTEFKGRRLIQILAILPLAVPGYISAYTYAEILEPSGFISQFLSYMGIDFIGICFIKNTLCVTQNDDNIIQSGSEGMKYQHITEYNFNNTERDTVVKQIVIAT